MSRVIYVRKCIAFPDCKSGRGDRIEPCVIQSVYSRKPTKTPTRVTPLSCPYRENSKVNFEIVAYETEEDD